MNAPLSALENDYPVELVPPDISAYAKGSDGVPYVHTFASDVPGPHVALVAVVHGNEPCGAIALDRLLEQSVRPVRGTLSLCFANVAAYAAFDREAPNASRWVEEDFNRLWSAAILAGERDSVELARARELRLFLETVDLLLDIHSMQHKTTPLMMAGPAERGRALAHQVGVPEIVVADEGHAAGPRLRDYGPFVAPGSDKNALLVECGQHWEASAADVALHTVARFLRATGVVPADFWEEHVAPTPRQRTLVVTERITIETDDFAFAEEFSGLEVIAAKGTVIAHDGARAVTTPYDDCVLVMPSRRLWKGQTAVRLGRFEG